MRIAEERQLNPVADEVQALTAVVRPILTGVLYSLKREVVDAVGGFEHVPLYLLPRLHRPGDGDCGICFEYSVHAALNSGDARVVERVADAARLCRINTANPSSILFGVEKHGSQQLLDTADQILTDDSRLLYGSRGQPAKLRKHLSTIAGAFRNRNTRPALPWSIRGVWKTDLFIGDTAADRWLATSVKINPQALIGDRGLRIGIVPTKQGRNDAVRLDEQRNLVICPLHHDADFMEAFYVGFRIVQAFLHADANVPSEVLLPEPPRREVARILTERRNYPVVEVIEALGVFAQPELLVTQNRTIGMQVLQGEPQTDLVVAPVPA